MGNWLKKIFTGRRRRKKAPSLTELYNDYFKLQNIKATVEEIKEEDFRETLAGIDLGLSLFPLHNNKFIETLFVFLPDKNISSKDISSGLMQKLILPLLLENESGVDGKYSYSPYKMLPVPYSNKAIAGLSSECDECYILKIYVNNQTLFVVVSTKHYKEFNKKIVKSEYLFQSSLDFMIDEKWSDAKPVVEVENKASIFCTTFLMPDSIPMMPEKLVSVWSKIRQPVEPEKNGVWFTLIYQFADKKIPVSYFFESKESGSNEKLKKVIPGFMKLIVNKIKHKSAELEIPIIPVGGKMGLPPKNIQSTLLLSGKLSSKNFQLPFHIYMPKVFVKLIMERLMSEDEVKYILESLGNWLLILEGLEKKILYNQIENVVKPIIINQVSMNPTNLDQFYSVYGSSAVLMADIIDILSIKDLRLILDYLSVHLLPERRLASSSLFYYQTEEGVVLPASYFNEQRIINNMGIYKQEIWNAKPSSLILSKSELKSLNLEVCLSLTKDVIKGKSNLSWRAKTILESNYSGFFERLIDLVTNISLSVLKQLLSIESPQLFLRSLSVNQIATTFAFHKDKIHWLKKNLSSQKFEDIGYRVSNILRDLENRRSFADDLYKELLQIQDKVIIHKSKEDEEKIG